MVRIPRLLALAGCLALSLAVGCTEENSATRDNNNHWVDHDATLGDGGADGSQGLPDSSADDAGPANNGTADASEPDQDATPGPPDATAPDATPADVSVPPSDASDVAPTLDTGSGLDGGGLGQSCSTNDDCQPSQVCCPNFTGGDDECRPADACRVSGGLCESEDDCAPGEGCCGFGGTQICSDRCNGGGSGGGDPCSQPSDCSGGDVCCVSFSGDNQCTPADQCQFGVVCSDNSQCQPGETCCDAPRLGNVCLRANLCRF